MNPHLRILVFILLFYSSNCNKSDASPVIVPSTSNELTRLQPNESLSVVETSFKEEFSKLLYLASVNVKGALISKANNFKNKRNTSDTTDLPVVASNFYENTDWSDFDESVTRDVVNEYVLKLLANEGGLCMLDGLKDYLQFWAHRNGSLRMRESNYNSKGALRLYVDKSHRKHNTDDRLEAEVVSEFKNKLNNVVAFSAAFNNLSQVPFKTLHRMRHKLTYLMLHGNDFAAQINRGDNFKNDLGIAWATFPKLYALEQLDISNCKIEFISISVFRNLTGLKTLYMSHNNILRVPSQVFHYAPNIQYLDLSNQNSLDIDLKIPFPPLEQILGLLVGVKVEQYAFTDLKNLIILDFSFTKLTKPSANAFSSLPPSIKYISLCYTLFPVLSTTLFKNTELVGIDMSGNSFAVYSLVDDSFSIVAKSLRVLLFEDANLKEVRWLRKLKNLTILSLAKNNIDNIGVETLTHYLRNLQVLDLSSNHVGNWYKRIFTNTTKLQVLNLRDNNINILTSEMLRDFQSLQYIGIGDNDFVCDCLLKDFVDIAISNKLQNCLINPLPYEHNFEFFGLTLPVDFSYQDLAVSSEYVPKIESHDLTSELEFLRQNRQKFLNVRVLSKYLKDLNSNPCPNKSQIILYDKINGSSMKFQLLDYADVHYWCFNETEKMSFFELDCHPRSFDDIIIQNIQNATTYVTIASCVVVFVLMISIVAYIKRWHIHYYWSSLKSAALLSVAAKEKSDSLYNLTESESNLMYDIFISYCQNDRQWVLEELMPNIETAGDLSICMHERDFEVGLPILDNIISCMDRSRCLMLLISSNFLLSHWCQFEMRLAQHRMFEASKEHVILVFLEDIPKHKRPKTLQYLMDVKTYIKWPSESSPSSKLDDKKLFWKRLRRSIKNI